MTTPSELNAASSYAMKDCAWKRDDAEDAALALLRSGMTEPEAAVALRSFAGKFPGPRRWSDALRDFAEESGRIVNRMGARLESESALRAAVVLSERRLGLRLLVGIKALHPLGDLVVVLELPEETLRAISPLAVAGHTRSPGWFLARVLFLPSKAIPGLAVGDRVLVEDRCSPDGAGYIPSEEFGLPSGGRVILVPCRRLPTPQRTEEMVERFKDAQRIKKLYPPDAYPSPDPETGLGGHPFWRTQEGRAVLVQLGEHRFQMLQILKARRGCGRNRLPKKEGEKDTVLPDGILAVLED